MDYQIFINQEIINGNHEEGVVISFNDEDVVVQYPHITKTYKTYLALHNQFLTFKDEKLNQIAQILQENETKSIEEKAMKEEKEKALLKLKRDRVNELYPKLARRNYAYQVLYGKDFVYPLFAQFIKQFGKLVIKRDPAWMSGITSTIHYHWYYYI